MAPKEKSELEKFIETLRRGTAAEREDTAAEIGSLYFSPLDSEAKLAVEALTEALSDEDADVRYEVGQALMFLGGTAFSAIPELLRVFMHDEDSWVRESAVWALSGIAKEVGLGGCNAQAVPLLIRALQDESEGIQGTAAITLGHLILPDRQQFAEVMTALEEVAEDSNEKISVGSVAYQALERLSGSNA